MSDIATALAPILILILVGYSLKQNHFLSDDAWSGMEKLTYFILFPALLVRTLGNQSLGGAPWAAMLLVVMGTLLLATALLIAWQQLGAAVNGATFTSIFQGGVRFNTYIALALAQAFYGVDGLAMGAVTAGFMIVLINLQCISAFSIWGTRSRPGLKPIIHDVIGNSLILACAVGWFLSLSGIGLPGLAEDILEIIGRAALPFGLLAVGAALKPRDGTWTYRSHPGLLGGPVRVEARGGGTAHQRDRPLRHTRWRSDYLSHGIVRPVGLYSGPATGRRYRHHGIDHHFPDTPGIPDHAAHRTAVAVTSPACSLNNLPRFVLLPGPAGGLRTGDDFRQ